MARWQEIRKLRSKPGIRSTDKITQAFRLTKQPTKRRILTNSQEISSAMERARTLKQTIGRLIKIAKTQTSFEREETLAHIRRTGRDIREILYMLPKKEATRLRVELGIKTRKKTS